MSLKKDDISLLNDVTQRILIACAAKKIKRIELIRNGIASQQTVYDVLNGKQKPGIDFILRFLEFIEDVDGNWLLTGEGEMNKSNSNSTGNIIKGKKNLTAGGGINQVSEAEKEYVTRIAELEEENSRLKSELLEAKNELLGIYRKR